ncbi:hypothetical protein BU26DRAFT_68464 [Trematosphaeria pertusa]|uniref:Uncharacterized protein n=1 Tax=Trematosphaeria pertusa TaxID=390896 RepID=A0A6A6I503_9PLEO|nr:uncharacterized protein BU26DRAFT_68464 [Trematosphaeria pertusa]KAF2245431.1 hypothetical protein BU26DRAFT_68464 [Trematosphaeria pertusa]
METANTTEASSSKRVNLGAVGIASIFAALVVSILALWLIVEYRKKCNRPRTLIPLHLGHAAVPIQLTTPRRPPPVVVHHSNTQLHIHSSREISSHANVSTESIDTLPVYDEPPPPYVILMDGSDPCPSPDQALARDGTARYHA